MSQFVAELLMNVLVYSPLGAIVTDGLKFFIQKHHKKTWEQVYIDSFQTEFKHQKDRLSKLGYGTPRYHSNELEKRLKRNWEINPYGKSLTDLTEKERLNCLIHELARDRLILNFQTDPPGERYASIMSDLVTGAQSIFHDKIFSDPSRFNENIQVDLKQLIVSSMKQGKKAEEAEKMLSWLISQKEADNRRINLKIHLSWSNISLRDRFVFIEDYLTKKYRVSGRNTMAVEYSDESILTELEDKISTCDIFIGLYSRFHDEEKESPVVAGKSLADLEVTLARKHFRHCVFFVADEPLSKSLNAVSRADEETDRSAFINALYRYFDTVEEFTEETDLQEQINSAIRRLGKSPWMGLSRPDIESKWMDRTRDQFSNLVFREQLHTPILSSPLWPIWEKFCEQSWISSLQKMIIDLQVMARAIQRDPDINEDLDKVKNIPSIFSAYDWNTVVAKLLNEWCPERLLDNISHHLYKLSKESPQDNVLAERFKQWRKSVQEYGVFLRKPAWARCFLVIGRSGSGKTHFLAELLNYQLKVSSPFRPCLYLSTSLSFMNNAQNAWEESFDQLILDAASIGAVGTEKNSLRWKNLEELDGFIQRQGSDAKLVIILDDYRSWDMSNSSDFQDKFNRYLESRTIFQSFVWVTTLSEADYTYVADYDQQLERFSARHCAPRSMISGWISLDKLNEGSELSDQPNEDRDMLSTYPALKKILEQELPVETVAHVVSFLPENSTSWRLLALPFTAWIVADLVKTGEKEIFKQLPNLRFLYIYKQFLEQVTVKKFKGKNLPKTDDGQSLKYELAKMIEILSAMILAGKLNEPQTIYGLAKEISRHAKEKSEMDKVRTRLEEDKISGRLLERGLARNGFLRKVEPIDQEKVILDFTPFWEYEAAKVFRREFDKNAECLLKYFHKDFKYSGILEFFLLIWEREIYEKHTDTKRLVKIASAIIEHLPHLRPEVWSAAAKSSGHYQNELVQSLVKLKIDLLEREDISFFLYFLKYADVAQSAGYGVSWLVRLQLLSKCYTAIGKGRMGSYFAESILEQMLSSNITGEELALALSYTRGIEENMDAAALTSQLVLEQSSYDEARSEWYEIGALCFKSLMHRTNQDNVLENLHDRVESMIDEILKNGQTGTTAGPSKKDQSEKKCVERDRIWACIARNFYHILVSNENVGVIRWLDDHQWRVWQSYKKDEFENLIDSALDEHLTIEIGRWWRNYGKVYKKEFLEVLNNLIKVPSEFSRQKTAFYIIQHSVSSPIRKDDKVHSKPYPQIELEFWQILEILHTLKNPLLKKAFKGKFYKDQKAYFSGATKN